MTDSIFVARFKCAPNASSWRSRLKHTLYGCIKNTTAYHVDGGLGGEPRGGVALQSHQALHDRASDRRSRASDTIAEESAAIARGRDDFGGATNEANRVENLKSTNLHFCM